MVFTEATASYESWLSQWTTIDEEGRTAKRAKMREDAFSFFRGSFYRWIQLWTESDLLAQNKADSSAATAPVVFSVGDIHLENFGLWRDIEGRLVWGVNDFDEAVALPYLQDVIRLCVSAVLAHAVLNKKGEPTLALTGVESCHVLWSAYCASIEMGLVGAKPIVLGQKGDDWLNALALAQIEDSGTYFAKVLDAKRATAINESEVPASARAALAALWPEPLAPAGRWYRRLAGVGSLGRPRYALVGEWRGGTLVREAKALVPSAWFWATGITPVTYQFSRALSHPLRSPDPLLRVIDQWVARRIASDCDKLDMSKSESATQASLLGAMGRELANVHLGCNSPETIKEVVAHAQAKSDAWILDVATRLAGSVQKDFADFKLSGQG